MVNLDSLWKEALSRLSAKIHAIGFEVWVQRLEPVCFVKNTLVLAAPSDVSKKTIEARYKDTIAEEVIESAKSTAGVSVAGVEIIREDEKEEYLNRQDEALPDTGFIIKDAAADPRDTLFSFNKKYTFDNFIVGSSNEFAAAAAKAVADCPGTKFNPLFIYGGVGLGKTHMMHAIGNYIQKNKPQIKVLYVSTNSFLNEYLDVIRQSNNSELNRKFREKYRLVDVLMLDDIQYTAGKDGVQEAIFHIFNDLHHMNKQIIFSSDRPPKDIAHLSERLRTRFTWGLTVDIQPPDLETRIAILEEKAKQEGFFLTPEVAHFIAENAESNVRDMEGLLNKVIFYSSLSGHPVSTVAAAREALKDIIDVPRDTIDANDIIFFTCKYFNISTADITGKKKNKEIVEPRMIAIYLITEMLSLPLVTIGGYFGGRDHTTVIHARDKIAEGLKTNPKLRIQLQDIKDMLLHR